VRHERRPHVRPAGRRPRRSRRSGRASILPNLFTSGGLFAGFYSIIATLNEQYWLAAVMILVAQLCDVLDGRVARLTRSTSSFGIQFDSLADLVAFGVAPGILVYQWALKDNWGKWGWLAASLYVTCGALRLARFNVQIASVEKRHFVGLPIPAAADVIAATVLLYYWLGGEGQTGKHILMLLVIFAVAASW
jgi:CDP-diacylglycerol--serine O-phosphatidyltransferase